MACSQTLRNLFPSCKLKGNCTFTTWTATIRNDDAEEDPGVKYEGEGEMEPSADEDVEASGQVGETDQSVEYMIHFDKAVELYQKKNKNCFRCGSPDHLAWDCPKDVCRSAQKAYLKHEGGDSKEVRLSPPQKPAAAQCASLDKMPWALGYHERLPSWTKTNLLTGVDLKT